MGPIYTEIMTKRHIFMCKHCPKYYDIPMVLYLGHKTVRNLFHELGPDTYQRWYHSPATGRNEFNGWPIYEVDAEEYCEVG